MQNTKTKKKSLKLTAEKKKQIAAVRGIADITVEARRLWNNILKVLRKNSFSLRVLYPIKLFFKSGGKIYFQVKTLLNGCVLEGSWPKKKGGYKKSKGE